VLVALVVVVLSTTASPSLLPAPSPATIPFGGGGRVDVAESREMVG